MATHFLIFLILLLNTLLWLLLTHYNIVSPEEYGSIENFQILQTLVATYIFFQMSRKSRSEAEKYFFIFFTFFTLNLTIREIEINELSFHVPELLIWLRHGLGFYCLFGFLWLMIFVKIFARLSETWILTFTWIKSSSFAYMILGGVLLFVSTLFDKQVIVLSKPWEMFWEEKIEVNAYFLVIASALLFKKLSINSEV